MPIKDGNAVIHEITDFDPDATIIIVSSVGTQSQLREAIEAGASDFIQKTDQCGSDRTYYYFKI